ncbi:MAG TPA: amino acid permease [Gemmataceae bacterium]|nr:amino acid permease [Gemmataceae bacterium]
MLWKQLFAKKSLEMLKAEAEGENRLRRVLGPIALTSLGVGAIIGAGIFVITGRVAAETAGPAILVSFAVAGVGCALAAFCYAEFASMAPVAGSAYTYAYATLGELLAWIIGWDLILEYAMSCATVASAWSEYFNKLTKICFNWEVPWFLSNDPFSKTGAWFNLPAVAILLLVTAVLVIGIRESAASNVILVIIKVGVVIFVVALGIGYINKDNWFDVPVEERKLPVEALIDKASEAYVEKVEKLIGKAADERAEKLQEYARAVYQTQRVKEVREELRAKDHLTPKVEGRLQEIEEKYEKQLPTEQKDRDAVKQILADAQAKVPEKETESWGLLGEVGLNKSLREIDDKTRSNFTPYGLSGVMLGAALVFFAFIGFDSISTHAEEAVRPQRDVPIGIIASLLICTVLYMAVAAVITGMQAYPTIDTKAAIASAFDEKAKVENSGALRASAALIAAGGLAGMTSVLLITFLSQARIFLAMARDGLLPERVFGAVHEKFKTPHISTMVTGGIIAVVAAFTPIQDLEKMVNIGTLFAFIIVCIAVMLLRIRRPDAHRPFRCPALFVVAPLGILVNVTMMLFLPLATWLRLVGWLAVGLCIYFSFGVRESRLGRQQRGEAPGNAV